MRGGIRGGEGMGRNVIKGVEEREKPLFRRGWDDAGGKYWGLSLKYIKISFCLFRV